MSATIDGRPRLSGMARRLETPPTTISIIDAGNLPGPIGVCDGDVLDAWCWKLGPTCVVLWRYLACRVGLDVDLADVAAYLGVPRYKSFKAFDRLEAFGRVHWTDPSLTTLAVVTNTHDPREPYGEAIVNDLDLLEAAVGIIANAHGGNWMDAPVEWHEAAQRWRDQYHERLDAALHGEQHSPPLDAALLPTLELRRRYQQSPMFHAQVDHLLGWLPIFVQFLAGESDRRSMVRAVRAFCVRHSDVQRCPKRSLLPEHYLSDGRCGCFLDPTVNVIEHTEALRAWIAATGPAINATRVRLDAARAALVDAREQMAMPLVNEALLLDWKVLSPARPPAHDHTDVDSLTIGCAGCIERRVVDQVVANLADWLDSSDPWVSDDAPPLPSSPPTPWRLKAAYRQLRGRGEDVHDVRGVLALWAAEHDR